MDTIFATLSEIKETGSGSCFYSELKIGGKTVQTVREKNPAIVHIRGYPFMDFIVLPGERSENRINIKNFNTSSGSDIPSVNIDIEELCAPKGDGIYSIERKINIKEPCKKKWNASPVSQLIDVECIGCDKDTIGSNTVTSVFYNKEGEKLGTECASEGIHMLVGDESGIYAKAKRSAESLHELAEDKSGFFFRFIETLRKIYSQEPKEVYVKFCSKEREVDNIQLFDILSSLESSPMYPFEQNANTAVKYSILEVGFGDRFEKAFIFTLSPGSLSHAYMLVSEKINTQSETVESVKKKFSIGYDSAALLKGINAET